MAQRLNTSVVIVAQRLKVGVTDELLEAIGLTAGDLSQARDGLEGEVEEAEAVLGSVH